LSLKRFKHGSKVWSVLDRSTN